MDRMCLLLYISQDRLCTVARLLMLQFIYLYLFVTVNTACPWGWARILQLHTMPNLIGVCARSHGRIVFCCMKCIHLKKKTTEKLHNVFLTGALAGRFLVGMFILPPARFSEPIPNTDNGMFFREIVRTWWFLSATCLNSSMTIHWKCLSNTLIGLVMNHYSDVSTVTLTWHEFF